jgi:hypothetical protein
MSATQLQLADLLVAYKETPFSIRATRMLYLVTHEFKVRVNCLLLTELSFKVFYLPEQ